MHNQKHIKRKTLLVYIILFVLGLGIVAQIVYTQIFEYKIWTLENYNITRLYRSYTTTLIILEYYKTVMF